MCINAEAKIDCHILVECNFKSHLPCRINIRFADSAGWPVLIMKPSNGYSLK